MERKRLHRHKGMCYCRKCGKKMGYQEHQVFQETKFVHTPEAYETEATVL